MVNMANVFEMGGSEEHLYVCPGGEGCQTAQGTALLLSKAGFTNKGTIPLKDGPATHPGLRVFASTCVMCCACTGYGDGTSLGLPLSCWRASTGVIPTPIYL